MTRSRAHLGFGAHQIIQNLHGWWNKLLYSLGWCRALWLKSFLFKIYLHMYTISTAWVGLSIKSRTTISAIYCYDRFLFYLSKRIPTPWSMPQASPFTPQTIQEFLSQSVGWVFFLGGYVPGVYWWKFLGCLNSSKSEVVGKNMSHMKGKSSHPPHFMTTSFQIAGSHFFCR